MMTSKNIPVEVFFCALHKKIEKNIVSIYVCSKRRGGESGRRLRQARDTLQPAGDGEVTRRGSSPPPGVSRALQLARQRIDDRSCPCKSTATRNDERAGRLMFQSSQTCTCIGMLYCYYSDGVADMLTVGIKEQVR
jgi:hypothetical protein